MTSNPISPLSPESGGAEDGIVTTIMQMPPQPLPPAVSTVVPPPTRKLRVLVLSSDTGGGHRASAEALKAALEQLHPTAIQVDIVDFFVDIAKGPFRSFPSQYAYMAKHPWMWKTTYEFMSFPLGRGFAEEFTNVFGHRKVRDAFLKYAPDLILSVHPLVNTISQRVLKEMRKTSGMPSVPYVTVVTDLGGAHATWFHKNGDMTYIPVEEVGLTARKFGVSESKIRQFGLPVRKDFWVPAKGKAAMREQLGMRPDIPAVLVVGGGDGVGGLKTIANHLSHALSQHVGADSVQLVVICGKNENLRSFLQTRKWPLHLLALGYVSNMSDWMAASDIICTKAGPGTLAEALIRGLPIIVTGFLPGQEEANVNYITSKQVGEFAEKPKEIAETVVRWLRDPEQLAAMSERARALGRPQASLEIAKDLVEVARIKTAENIQILERQRRLRLAAGHDGDMEHPRTLIESSPESHLLFRVRFLLRVVFGTMLAQKALNRDGRTPPSSPMDTPSRASEELTT